jgi:rapamycin-insensitive companion of mTOR
MALTSTYLVGTSILICRVVAEQHQPIRLFATNHLGRLIRKNTTPVAWQLRLLVTQMYDHETSVCELAARFLEEVCEEAEVLQAVVEMHPTFEHLGETAHPLLLK